MLLRVTFNGIDQGTYPNWKLAHDVLSWEYRHREPDDLHHWAVSMTAGTCTATCKELMDASLFSLFCPTPSDLRAYVRHNETVSHE